MTFPDETQPFVDPSFGSQPEASAAQDAAPGFCQQCGTPLTEHTRRAVGNAIFCEPCLAARLAGMPSPGPAAAYSPWAAAAVPAQPSGPNPALAAVLGFIPGVGAMYNEQYAKGIAHLTIFALLVVLADSNGIFGLFVAGWEFYMAIEAYHTARARRDGTPLPNPFGFNELGDRLGFGKSWTSPGSRRPYPFAESPADTSEHVASSAQTVAPGAAYPAASAASGSSALYPYPSSAYPATAGQPYAQPSFVPVASPEPAGPVAPASPLLRFPAGAIWLILLGVLFLLTTTGVFRGFSAEALVGWSFIGLAAWVFLRRLNELSAIEPSIPVRVTRSLHISVWLLTSGILALLDSFGVLGWSRSWPIYLIVAGVMAMLSRLPTHGEIAASTPVSPTQPGSGTTL